MIVDLRPEGLYLEGTSWLGRGAVGDKPRVVLWDDISTLERTSVGIKLREGRKVIQISVPSKMQDQAGKVVEEIARQFTVATGRTLTTAKVTRAEKLTAVGDVYGRALVRRIDEISEVLSAADHAREVALSHDLIVWAKSQKVKSGVEFAAAKLQELRVARGAHIPQQVGVVVGAAFGPNIVVFDDRVHMGRVAYPIDVLTEAQVYVDGQVQVTTRPSMTAAAFGSILPGTALIPAMAFGKKEKTDTRVAEFHIGSRGWVLKTRIPIGALSDARATAQRVNAIAAGIQRVRPAEADPVPEAPAASAPDITSQIERIVELERAGAITPEQAAAMKAQIIGL
ncbi:hypothetical protein [Microbacterium sp. EST19A]|uniref:hypothetical protein n=1 Tax=Microbacterium sp. EST19A TaxID=2862681 RepID=UPI001CC0E7F4|nr:hypothetical protein [Microbacterium sp. EST19A]